jgi:hypothetical protein
VRLERFLPRDFGYAMPVTVSYLSSASAPLFVTNSDIRASDLPGLRAPHDGATAVALSVRRTTPLDGGWIAPIVNNLSLYTSVNTGDSQTEFQTAHNTLVTGGLDYVIGGGPHVRAMPEWWDHALGSLPGWMTNSEFIDAMRHAQLHVNPAIFRFSTNLSKGDGISSSYTDPAVAVGDTASTVRNLTNLWRNSTSLELRPFDAITARWDLTSVRDLRHYGDSTLTAATATSERTRLLGFDAGLERERTLNTTYTFSPALKGWLRPRLDFFSGYALVMDPNSTDILREADSTGAFRLPRRFTGLQSFTAATGVDLARLSSEWVHDSATRADIARTLLPVDVNYTRTLTSAFDGTPFAPGLAYQFGLTSIDGFLSDHGFLASSAGSNAQVTLSGGLRLPYGITLTARTQRVATRNWVQNPDLTEQVVDGEQVTLPDFTLRATLRLQWFDRVIESITPSARVMITNQRMTIPSGSPLIPNDVRTSRVQSYPLGLNVVWVDPGKLTTSFTLANTFRVDSLPGAVANSRAQELSADASRSFQLPREWQMKSALRARLGYQQSRATSYVDNGFAAGAESRLADNGRQAITLNADTDVAENLTFSLQSARIVTFDNNLNRHLTQMVFSAVLQISFFAGELR